MEAWHSQHSECVSYDSQSGFLHLEKAGTGFRGLQDQDPFQHNGIDVYLGKAGGEILRLKDGREEMRSDEEEQEEKIAMEWESGDGRTKVRVVEGSEQGRKRNRKGCVKDGEVNVDP